MLTQTIKTLCIDKNGKIEKDIAWGGIETKKKREDGACNPGQETNSPFWQGFFQGLARKFMAAIVFRMQCTPNASPEHRLCLFSNTAPSQNPNRRLRQVILIIRRG
jgi:hypothetical protein